MRRNLLAAALMGVGFCSEAPARAQEWGGVAGIAASRGYTASAGLSGRSPGDAPPPADAEALAPPPVGPAPALPVGSLAGDVARRRPAGVTAARVRGRHHHGRRHPGGA